MRVYFRERTRVFTVSAPFGIAASTVLLSIFRDNVLALLAIKLYGKWFAYLIYILPILGAYELGYFLNRLLIRKYGAEELRVEAQYILVRLVDASLSEASVRYDPDDLVEEEAWAMLRKYWRKK